MVAVALEGPPVGSRAVARDVTVREVFEQEAPYVWRTLRYLGVPGADVNDATQEVFVVVHRKLGSFEHRSSIRGWLYGICIRIAAAYRRRAHVRHEELTDALPERAIEPDQTRRLEASELQALLLSSLNQLDDDKRVVFVLHEVEELPMSEVARIVGCPLQTAYSRHRAAKATLSRAWKRAGLSTGEAR